MLLSVHNCMRIKVIIATFLLAACGNTSRDDILNGRFLSDEAIDRRPVQLLHPADKSISDTEITLTWRLNTGITDYKLYIADNENFTGADIYSVKGNTFDFKAESSKTHFWKVTTGIENSEPKTRSFYPLDAVYVNNSSTASNETGSINEPFKSINKGIELATQTGNLPVKVAATSTAYSESIFLSNSINIRGNYDESDWSEVSDKAQINLTGGHEIFFSGLSDQAEFSHFNITSDNTGQNTIVTIRNCSSSFKFHNNYIWGAGNALTIEQNSVAILCENNCDAVIENNRIQPLATAAASGKDSFGILIQNSSEPFIHGNQISAGKSHNYSNGIGIYNSGTGKIYNNTIVATQEATTVTSATGITWADSSPGIQNNIIITTNDISDYCLYTETSTGDAEPDRVDNNFFLDCTILYHNDNTGHDYSITSGQLDATGDTLTQSSGNYYFVNSVDFTTVFNEHDGADNLIYTLADNDWHLNNPSCDLATGGLSYTETYTDSDGDERKSDVSIGADQFTDTCT